MESLNRQQILSSFEADREEMELRATQRTSLKSALNEIESTNKKKSWMQSTNTSFFLVPKDRASELLKEELARVEDELARVCKRIQDLTQ